MTDPDINFMSSIKQLKTDELPILARIVPHTFFYGWVIAIAIGVQMIFVQGIGYYALSVFLGPLQDEHDWSNALVSGSIGMYFVVTGITAGIVGPFVDRQGPIKFMAIGFTLVGLSAIAIGFIKEPWQLYVVFLILAVGLGMSANVATNAIITRWFVHKRARAITISSTGISLGGVLFAPFGAWLVTQGGLQLAAPVMGIMVLIIALPVLWLAIIFDPRQLGSTPDGLDVDQIPTSKNTQLNFESQNRIWTRNEALHTFSFWAILISFTLVLISQTGFVIHEVVFLEDRFESKTMAAAALSLTAFASILARLFVGMIADMMDKRLLTSALFILQASVLLLITRLDGTVSIYLLTFLFGCTIGNIYMMQTLLVGEIFGMISFGSVFGIIAMSGQIGSAMGPLVIGFLEEYTGGYDIPFTCVAITTYLAAFVILAARPTAITHRVS